MIISVSNDSLNLKSSRSGLARTAKSSPLLDRFWFTGSFETETINQVYILLPVFKNFDKKEEILLKIDPSAICTDNTMFHWADYVIFILVLLISTSIGIYYAIKTRKSQGSGSDELLTGGKKLSVVPVTLSLLASFMSAIFILGMPVEIYAEGGIYWWIATGNVPAILITAGFIAPIFYRLKLTSAYEVSMC